MSAPAPDLSVVICTLDRYEDLRRCLDALAPGRQRDAPPYEVLVVDQTEPAKPDLLSRDDRFVRHLTRAEPGLSSARNAGIAASRGRIVAFLDDDAIPGEHWAARIASAFAPGSADYLACGGAVSADYRKGERPAWMTGELEHYLSCVDWSPHSRPLRPDEWIVGANMAVAREAFERYGTFDVGLGRSGASSLLSNEEIKLIRRIGHARILYEPAAAVRHVIPLERMRQGWFRKRAHWQAISDVLAGLDVMTAETAWQEVAGFPEASGSRLPTLAELFSDCHPERFPRQVKAVYALSLLAAKGAPVPAGFEAAGPP